MHMKRKKGKAMRRLVKAANMGKPHALYRLGLLYEEGKKCPQDQDMAVLLILAAANLGYTPAQDWIEGYSFDDSAAVQAEA